MTFCIIFKIKIDTFMPFLRRDPLNNLSINTKPMWIYLKNIKKGKRIFIYKAPLVKLTNTCLPNKKSIHFKLHIWLKENI